MIVNLESLAVFAFALITTLLCDAYVRRRRSIAATPPGPAPLPFVGNLLDIPVRAPWKTYAAWGREYGSDLISVRSLGQLTIVVNSAKAARELFDKRAFNYSDRPYYMMIHLMGWDWNIGLMPYGDRWRTCRRMLHQFMHDKASKAYDPLLADKAAALLKDFQRDPDDFREHIAHYTTSIAMSIAYAYDVDRGNDQYASVSKKAVAKLSCAVFPGAVVANAFPICIEPPSVLVPWYWFQTYAKETRSYTTLMREAPMEYVEKEMASGTAKPSMSLTMIEANDANNGGRNGMQNVKDVAGITFAAGSDTTLSSITSFMLAMVLNPSVQRRAQAEIDAVVGRDRLPAFEDRALLPYVGAVCREVLRWKSVTPLGVARKAMQDDEYDGYLIRAGSILHYNTWAILHDPEHYFDPESFRPERFLNNDGSLNSDDVGPAFGFGRRVCVGMHLARSSLWISMASILATFDITILMDENGNEIPVEVDYSDGLTSHPASFKCSITPRDAKAAALVREPDVLA